MNFRRTSVTWLWLLAPPLWGQTPARPSVAVLNLRFDGEHATVPEPGDTAVVAAATSKLIATLRSSERLAVVDSGTVAAAVSAAANVNSCDKACARAVAQRLGAAWVTSGTVTKTSNLVWVLTAELFDAVTGRSVLADSYELKGDARTMAPAGAHVFAQRVLRALTEP